MWDTGQVNTPSLWYASQINILPLWDTGHSNTTSVRDTGHVNTTSAWDTGHVSTTSVKMEYRSHVHARISVTVDITWRAMQRAISSLTVFKHYSTSHCSWSTALKELHNLRLRLIFFFVPEMDSQITGIFNNQPAMMVVSRIISYSREDLQTFTKRGVRIRVRCWLVRRHSTFDFVRWLFVTPLAENGIIYAVTSLH